MTTFGEIIKFFNSKKSKKVFTRAEYFNYMAYQSKVAFYKESYLDTVRRYLCAAGYLVDFEPGTYRKMKPIPKDLTISKLEREAYPNAKRFK